MAARDRWLGGWRVTVFLALASSAIPVGASPARWSLALTGESVAAIQQDAKVVRPVVGLCADLAVPLRANSDWSVATELGAAFGETRQQAVLDGYPGAPGYEKRLWMECWSGAVRLEHATQLPGGTRLVLGAGYRYRWARSRYRAPSVVATSPGTFTVVYPDLTGSPLVTHGVLARLGVAAALTDHVALRVDLSGDAGFMHGRSDRLEITEVDAGLGAAAGLEFTMPSR